MVDSMVITIPTNLLVMMFSITTSSLGLAVLCSQDLIVALLLFIVGGYISAGLLVIPMFFKLIQTPVLFICQLISFIFQIVTGIIFCININHQHSNFSRGFKYWEVVIPILFIINVFLMAVFTTLFSFIFLQGYPKGLIELDLEKNTESLLDSLCNTPIENNNYFKGEDTLSQHLNIIAYPQVSKKVSDQTLVEAPLYDTVVRNKNNASEENDLSYIIQYPSSGQIETSDYLYYTNNNWMDSNTLMTSMKLSEELHTTDTPTKSNKKSNFSLFRFNTKLNELTTKHQIENSRRIRNLRQSHSVPNLLKSTNFEDKFNKTKLHDKFHSIPVSNFSKIRNSNNITIQNTSATNFILDENDLTNNQFEVGKRRKVSLIDSIPENYDTLVEEENNTVKRSKSTGYINACKSKKINWEQRRKSIHEEKSFLQNVDESLLPAVLRSGESPIVGLKRKQQELIDKKSDMHNKSPRSRHNASSFSREHTADLSPVGETEMGEVETSIIEKNDSETQNSEHIHLPYISEFEESIDQENFKGFDQNTAFVEDEYPVIFEKTPRKKGEYNFSDIGYDKKTFAQSGQELKSEELDVLPEEYFKSFNGLEKIPKSTSYSSIIWNQDAHSKNMPLLMNHISLKDWDEKSEMWNEQRARSGVNLNIPGITRLVSDHNLKTMSTGSQSVAPLEMSEEYLLPPLELRLDNIDSLSDLHSSLSRTKDNGRARSCTSLNRSSSAPSLHTYRDLYKEIDSDISDSLKESYSNEAKSTSIKSLDNTLRHVNTPPDHQIGSTASSSPIKKFFQESPKRLSIMLRKPMNTTYSLNLNSLKGPLITSHHQHTGSVVSNQFSLYSGKSSKSNSPRKSIRAMLRSPSKQRTPSTAAQSLAELSKAKQSSLFNAEDDVGLLYIAENALSFWDLETAQSSDKSRVSSVPSAVIGEYDREKWRTLKALENHEKVTFDTIEL